MKTININLIGEFAKTIKSGGIEFKEDSLDPRTRILVIVFVLCTFITLAVSFGLWLGANNMTARKEIDLKKLQAEMSELEKEQAKLSAYAKEIKYKKKLADLKLLAKEQIDNLFIPWSLILEDLSTKIPKKIIITDIKKNSTRGGASGMSISGLVSAKEKPLTEVSFLILNINEDKNSLLSNAEIKKLNYEKDSDYYEFEIEANLSKTTTGKKHE